MPNTTKTCRTQGITQPFSLCIIFLLIYKMLYIQIDKKLNTQ